MGAACSGLPLFRGLYGNIYIYCSFACCLAGLHSMKVLAFVLLLVFGYCLVDDSRADGIVSTSYSVTGSVSPYNCGSGNGLTACVASLTSQYYAANCVAPNFSKGSVTVVAPTQGIAGSIGMGCVQNSNGAVTSFAGSLTYVPVACTAHSSNGGANGLACTCDVGYVVSGATCVARSACASNGTHDAQYGQQVAVSSSSYSSQVCINGCAYSSPSGAGLAGTSTWYQQVGASTGSTCTGSTGAYTGQTASDPNTFTGCPSGETLVTNAYGYICALNSQVSAGTVPTTTNVETTAASGVVAAGSQNPSSSATTVTGSVTVSGTTTVAGTVSLASNPVSDYCTANPNAGMCKVIASGTFSGTCGSTPSCTDNDAVLCSQAIAEFQSACSLAQQYVTGTTESNLVAGVLAGTDIGITASPAASGVRSTISMSSVVTTGSPVFSRAGLSDVSFSTGTGYPVNLPMSRLNSFLTTIGEIGVAVTLCLAAFIVFF